jgi:hypothetical protein
MMTFAEFIFNESERSEYHDWGIIHPSGRIESGRDHPTAKEHTPLIQSAMRRRKDNGKVSDYGTYSQEKKTGRLNLYTSSKTAVNGTIKAYSRLPHTASSEVSHDHIPADYKQYRKELPANHIGHKAAVFNRLKSIRQHYSEEDK